GASSLRRIKRLLERRRGLASGKGVFIITVTRAARAGGRAGGILSARGMFVFVSLVRPVILAVSAVAIDGEPGSIGAGIPEQAEIRPVNPDTETGELGRSGAAGAERARVVDPEIELQDIIAGEMLPSRHKMHAVGVAGLVIEAQLDAAGRAAGCVGRGRNSIGTVIIAEYGAPVIAGRLCGKNRPIAGCIGIEIIGEINLRLLGNGRGRQTDRKEV